MKNLLERYLKVYPHELNKFLWISGIFFVSALGLAFFRNYVDAAFLKRYGPQYIPYMLVINALLTFAVFGVANRLGRRFLDYSILSWFMLFYGVSSIVLFFMVKADYSIAYPILYQLLYLLDSIMLVYLWNVAGDLFDARQGKRIFPFITAFQVLATTIGSFGTKPFTMYFGEDQTLILFAVTSAAVGGYTLMSGSGYFSPKKEVKTAGSKSSSISITEVPGLMAKYPIIRYLIIIGLTPNILLPIFFYQFSEIAASTFHSEQSLISFLSIFRGCTTLASFFLLFFMGRMYQTIGLTNSALIQPLNFTVLFAGLLSFFNIFVAAYGQFSVVLIQRAIAGPVNKIFFNIIPSELQTWSRTFVRGTVLKVGMLAGSLIMIFLKPVLSPRYFSAVALVLALHWLYETLVFRKHYKKTLKQVIVEREIDFDQIESVRAFDSGSGAVQYGPVSVEVRSDKPEDTVVIEAPRMAPDVALALLDDVNPLTRAEAASSCTASRDMRAVNKLIVLLGDEHDEVRKSSMEALMSYGEEILPYLEVSLLEGKTRSKQAILEIIRLSGLRNFESVPFLGQELHRAYSNLVAIQNLNTLPESPLVNTLIQYLKEDNDETLSLIFYALWVSHADMRLMYQALQSETASLAVELVENSVAKEIVPFLIPLIEDIPLDEKVMKGRRLFPLVRQETHQRILTFLASADDPVKRFLSILVIGETTPQKSFIPIVEARLNDESEEVRQAAMYALRRVNNEVGVMPEIIDKINNLKKFSIFEGMGVRELYAIASVVSLETFSPGDILIREQEENSSIYLIVSGDITIYKGYGTDQQVEKVTIGSGSFMGELSLFTRMAPNATCVAATPTLVYVLRHQQFQGIMRIYPQIGINLCRFFTLKLRQTNY